MIQIKVILQGASPRGQVAEMRGYRLMPSQALLFMVSVADDALKRRTQRVLVQAF
jgi:hypothetical protein